MMRHTKENVRTSSAVGNVCGHIPHLWMVCAFVF